MLGGLGGGWRYVGGWGGGACGGGGGWGGVGGGGWGWGEGWRNSRGGWGGGGGRKMVVEGGGNAGCRMTNGGEWSRPRKRFGRVGGRVREEASFDGGRG